MGEIGAHNVKLHPTQSTKEGLYQDDALQSKVFLAKVDDQLRGANLPMKHLLQAIRKTVKGDSRTVEWFRDVLEGACRVRTRQDANLLLEQEHMLFMPGGTIQKFSDDKYRNASKDYFEFKGARRENGLALKHMKVALTEQRVQFEADRAVRHERKSKKQQKAERRSGRFPEAEKSRAKRGKQRTLVGDLGVAMTLCDLPKFDKLIKAGHVGDTEICGVSVKGGVDRAVEMYNDAVKAREHSSAYRVEAKVKYVPKLIREKNLYRARLDAEGEAVHEAEFATVTRFKPLKLRGVYKAGKSNQKRRAVRERLVGIEENPGPRHAKGYVGRVPTVPKNVPPQPHRPELMREEIVKETLEAHEKREAALPQPRSQTQWHISTNDVDEIPLRGVDVLSEYGRMATQVKRIREEIQRDNIDDGPNPEQRLEMFFKNTDALKPSDISGDVTEVENPKEYGRLLPKRFMWVTKSEQIDDLYLKVAVPDECQNWLKGGQVPQRPSSLMLCATSCSVAASCLIPSKLRFCVGTVAVAALAYQLLKNARKNMLYSIMGWTRNTVHQGKTLDPVCSSCYAWRASMFKLPLVEGVDKRGPVNSEYKFTHQPIIYRLVVERLRYAAYVVPGPCPVEVVFSGYVDALTALDSFSYQCSAKNTDVLIHSHFNCKSVRGVNSGPFDPEYQMGTEWWLFVSKLLHSKFRHQEIGRLFRD